MPDPLSSKSDPLSFHICSNEDVVTDLANEMQSIVFGAAQPIAPGESIKTQIRRAWQALGRPSYWRVRAAWYREAGCWSGEAVKDFEWRDRRRRQKEDAARENARQAANALIALRNQHLAASDTDFRREQIVAIDTALAAMGCDMGAMDGATSEGEGRA